MEDELTITEFLDVLRSRRSSYAFLSRMYGEEVSFALLSELANSKNLIAEEDATSEGHGILKEFARRLNESDLKTVETDLAAEYASLFLGAGSRPVFPYESVYTSEERLVMQKARDEVLSVYKQEGLDRSKEYNEPEDHIAIELEFMAYLCQKTIEAIEKGDKEGVFE
jgi:TorA maturation chaperone TorD